MKKKAAVRILCLGLFLLIVWATLPVLAQNHAQNFVRFVDPFLGADFGGEAFVGATLPFGMVRVGPDVQSTDGIPSSNGYASSGVVVGFSHLHLNGAAGKYGNILLLPTTGDFDASHFGSFRSEEANEPGYYTTRLKRYGIFVQLTATEHAALHRYEFPAGKTQHIALSVDHCLTRGNDEEGQRFLGGELHAVSLRRIEGFGRYRGGWNEGGEYRVYFTIELNQAVKTIRTWAGGVPEAIPDRTLDVDKPLGAVMDFSGFGKKTVQVKVGISFVSVARARANAQREIPSWNFDAVRGRARMRWEKSLRVIEIHGASERQRRIFYTALYHALLTPSDRTGENPLWKSDEPYYDDYYAIWDTFRTQAPLLTLIAPGRQRDILRSLIDIYRHEGYLPDGRSGNDTGRTQGGSNADVMLADAFVKKLSGVDYATAYKAMLKNAFAEPANPRKWGRGGLTEFNQLGYVANDTERAGSRTVEYSYDNFVIAEVACGLGHAQQANELARSASNWRNLWDVNLELEGVHGFLHPKDSKGQWTAPDLTLRGSWRDFFYEGDLWTYSLYVPQDVRGLIQIAGGPQAFVQRLSRFFLRKHFDISNEPGFLTPMLFHWIGRPDLTADVLASYVEKYFTATRAGIPGNDDSGAMSSWYLFQALGFYPVAGQDVYLINVPQFAESRIHLGHGKVLRIVTESGDARPFRRYVQSVTWNGKPLDTSWFHHAMIANGGTLRLTLGSEPSPWGRKLPPPSLSDTVSRFCPAQKARVE